MLRVYRGWIITPISEKDLVAQKNGRVIMGEWEEIVPKIDDYEYEQARKERENAGVLQHTSFQVDDTSTICG